MVESEESENRDIGRDVLSKNRRSRMSILIFYYYSDLAIIGLFWSETRRDTVQDYFVGKRVWPPSEIYFEPYYHS